MSSVKKLCLCALCIALCCVLPTAFHGLGLGTALSPMHMPVLLCGLVCGPWLGAVCGVAGPILSSLTTGMPGAPMLMTMVPELCIYGLCAGLFMMFVRTGRLYADLYLALVPAMILGRVAGGIAQSILYLSGTEHYTLAMWVSSYFVGTLPGAVLHLLILPALVLAVTKAGLIPSRYALSRAEA